MKKKIQQKEREKSIRIVEPWPTVLYKLSSKISKIMYDCEHDRSSFRIGIHVSTSVRYKPEIKLIRPTHAHSRSQSNTKKRCFGTAS